MTIFSKEMRQGRNSLIIWTVFLSVMLGLCIVAFPQMKEQMATVSDSFAQMGAFSEAMGMEQMNFGNFQDYFAVELGYILGLIGAIYAGILGIKLLAGEEGGHTAEFLLTHPITRKRVVGEKLGALVIQVVILNVIVCAICFGLFAAIDEDVDNKNMIMLFASNALMHLEIAGIAFGVSAFLRRNNYGVGIGIGAIAYFLNIFANLLEDYEWLKYITPMGYTDSAPILHDGTLETGYIGSGMVILLVFVVIGLIKYSKKEIH